MLSSELVLNMAVALALAFGIGYAAKRVGLPVIVGYIAAGLVISSSTPGWSADTGTVRALADIGVIFLMFGIGLTFDIRDLRAVGKIALPGVLVTFVVVSGVVYLVTAALGLGVKDALVVALAINVSSSTVLSRTLLERGLVSSIPGRIAVGWSATDDLSTIAIIALLPGLGADGGGLVSDTAISLLKAAVFVFAMLLLGARVIPWTLRHAVLTGSRELFILGVVAVALGIAAGASFFDVSLALGAFIAGVAISESELGHQATADVIPLREAFAVLFFVSVGMLIEPGELVDQVGLLAVVIVLVVLLKTLVILLVFAFYPYPGRTAIIVAVSLAQFGEFSFLIAQTSLDNEVIESGTYNLLLAAAAVSIALNPLWVRLATPIERLLEQTGPLWRMFDQRGPVPVATDIRPNHVVVLGFGRVGELTGHALHSLDLPFVIVEEDIERARRLAAAGFNVVWGDAAAHTVLEEASIDRARAIVVALPDEASTILAVQAIRRLAPNVPIIARARAQEELRILADVGVTEAVVPEYEGGLELMRRALVLLGFPEDEVDGFQRAMRDIHYGVESHA